MRLLEKGDEDLPFVCSRGAAQVEYLRVHAAAAHAADMSRTYVLLGPPGGPELIGFYAICMGRITSTDLPENKGKKLTQTAAPAALLAQLARDDRTDKGLGATLVLDALERIAGLADQIGCCGTFLHAQVPRLVDFYQDIGFRRIGKSDAAHPLLWMSMKDIRATFAQEALDAASEDLSTA